MDFKFENINLFKPISLEENLVLRKKLLEKKKKIVDVFRPKELDFVDIYEEEEILKDLEEIRKLEESFEKDQTPKEKYNQELSSLLEAVIADQIEVNNWLGENTEIIPASRYDDIKNGIDIISVHKDRSSAEFLGLGVDVTFASNKENLIKKLENIKFSIKSGDLGKLKYFINPDTGLHEHISLPKVIIGSRQSSAEKLLKLWVNEEDKEKNKKLSESTMQSKIIIESIYQLKYFHDYALRLMESEKQEDKKAQYENIKNSYANMYNIYIDIYKEKEEVLKSHINEISDDIVFETILDYVNSE